VLCIFFFSFSWFDGISCISFASNFWIIKGNIFSPFGPTIIFQCFIIIFHFLTAIQRLFLFAFAAKKDLILLFLQKETGRVGFFLLDLQRLFLLVYIKAFLNNKYNFVSFY